MLDLALSDQLLHGSRDVLYGHVRVDPVLVEEVDRLHAEALQGAFRHLLDRRRVTVEPERGGRARRALLEAELGRNHDSALQGSERLADELLVREGAVDLGRVEERDAQVEGGADEREHVLLVGGGAEAVAHAHATEAEGRDGEALAECACLHALIVPGTGRARGTSRRCGGRTWCLSRSARPGGGSRAGKGAPFPSRARRGRARRAPWPRRPCPR